MVKRKNLSGSFGAFVRELRSKKKIGQRELAKKIGVAASYLNDIEKEKRSAPNNNIVKKLSKELEVDITLMFDLAGASKKTIATDIEDYIKNNPEIVSLIRTMKQKKLNSQDISEIEKKLDNNETKALIVAAGLGSRLKKHTENLPKCMLDFNGKTLLQRQIEAYKQNGIEDITVIRGYKKEKINYKDLKYVTNKDYKNNNILNSIFYAEKIINGNIIIAYSDILFDSSVVKRLLNSDHDISVVVDIDWRGYYVGRKDHPLSEAENVIFDSNNQVIKIGKIGAKKNDVHGEFIGMIKLSKKGSEIFKQNFHRVKNSYWNKPFQRAKVFQNSYLTDMLQELVDIGVKVHCVIIERGWKEIDTVEDYQKAIKEFNE
tara:strand:- start:12 stop:1133 length:1122 start_codon:yes stop_codon:yes gene_type:complete